MVSLMILFFFMIRLPPRSTRSNTLLPYTSLLRTKQGGSVDCRNALVGLDGGDSAFVSPIQVQPQKIMIACYAFRLGGRHAAWLPIFQQEGAAHTRHRR